MRLASLRRTLDIRCSNASGMQSIVMNLGGQSAGMGASFFSLFINNIFVALAAIKLHHELELTRSQWPAKFFLSA